MRNSCRIIALTIVSILSFSACVSSQNTRGTAPMPIASQAEKDAIVFLFFEIEKKEDQCQISLTAQKTRDGRLKSENVNVRNKNAQLIVAFYAGEKLLYEITMDHPLIKTFEVAAQGTKGFETHSKMVEKDIFMIRIQKDKSITQLRFKELIRSDTKQQLQERLLNNIAIKL